ncbi:MAG: hypothetical protein Q8900_04730 [Bacillota bacterium]|nr:hypothetical protein [Bacillota bacterium]
MSTLKLDSKFIDELNNLSINMEGTENIVYHEKIIANRSCDGSCYGSCNGSCEFSCYTGCAWTCVGYNI